MPPDKIGKQFLILLSVSPATPVRLQTFVPGFKAILERISLAPVEQMFRSIGADHFGYLIRSKLAAGQIRAILEAPQKHSWERNYQPIEPVLTNSDNAIVLELGSDFSAQTGFARPATWLQRH